MSKLLADIKQRQTQQILDNMNNCQAPPAQQPATSQHQQQRKRKVVATQEAPKQPKTKHGSFVNMEDGTTGIYIDYEEEMRRIEENNVTKKRLMNLTRSSGLINEENQEYVIDENGNHVDPGEDWLRKNPFDTRAPDMRKIKEGFSGLSCGIKGLVPIESEEAKLVEEAIEKVRSGEVVLPTPEEYEQQRAAAEQRKRERMERIRNKGKQNKSPQKTTKSQQKHEKKQTKPRQLQKKQPIDMDVDSDDLKMAEMPKYNIIKKGVLEQMIDNQNHTETIKPKTRVRQLDAATVEQLNNATNTTGVEQMTTPKKSKLAKPVATAMPKQVPYQKPAEIEEPVESTQSVYAEEPQPVQNYHINTDPALAEPEPETEPESEEPEEIEQPIEQQPEHAPIDMFALKEELENAPEPEPEAEPESEEPEAKSDVVHIEVPNGHVKEFAEHLPDSTYEKIQASKVVHIEEVSMENVPTATRRISDIIDYRRLNSRRPTNEVGELAERALVNSGIIVVVNRASSIEMATIFTGNTAADVDYEKAYEFAYRHTVDTSIGKMSYAEYQDVVHPFDLDTVIEGIYSISEAAERKVTMSCVEDIGGCGASFELPIKVNTLPDLDLFPEESKQRVAEIVKAKSDPEAAKKLQQASPSVWVKVIKLNDRYIDIRSTNIRRINEFNADREYLTNKYPGIIIALLNNVYSITVETKNPETGKMEYTLIDDIRLLSEELFNLTDNEINVLKDVLVNIKEYVPMSYSIKGPYRCPVCGKVYNRASLESMMQLVFQAAQTT